MMPIVVQIAISFVLSMALFYAARKTVMPRMRAGFMPLWLGMILMGAPTAAIPLIMMLLGIVGIGVAIPWILVVALVAIYYVSGAVAGGAVWYVARRRRR